MAPPWFTLLGRHPCAVVVSDELHFLLLRPCLRRRQFTRAQRSGELFVNLDDTGIAYGCLPIFGQDGRYITQRLRPTVELENGGRGICHCFARLESNATGGAVLAKGGKRQFGAEECLHAGHVRAIVGINQFEVLLCADASVDGEKLKATRDRVVLVKVRRLNNLSCLLFGEVFAAPTEGKCGSGSKKMRSSLRKSCHLLHGPTKSSVDDLEPKGAASHAVARRSRRRPSQGTLSFQRTGSGCQS